MIKIKLLNRGILENVFLYNNEQDRIEIGREENNDIMLNGLGIKRFHCYIEFDGIDYWLFPDEGDIDSRKIKVGDEIGIKSYTLKIESIEKIKL